MMYELYLEMGLYAFLNLRNIQWANWNQIAVSCVAFVAMGWIVLFPMISFTII